MKSIEATVMVLFAAALFLFPVEGHGGIVRHEFTSRVFVSLRGPVQVDTEVRNSGDAVAFQAVITHFLADLVDRSGDLGDNPPGGTLHYQWLFQGTDLKPGNYVLATRLTFAGQEAEPHRAYHFSPFTYGMDRKATAPPPVTARLESPSFNKKALWQETKKIGLTLKNSSQAPVKAFVTFYLPDGFATPEPERFYDLSAGQERKENIPLKLDSGASPSPTYHAVVWYEVDGVRYAEKLDGQIVVVEKPVIFKGFLVVVGLVLLITAAALFYRKKIKSN